MALTSIYVGVFLLLGLCQRVLACTARYAIAPTADEIFYYDSSTDPFSALIYFDNPNTCPGTTHTAVLKYGSTQFTCQSITLTDTSGVGESICDITHAGLVDQGVYSIFIDGVPGRFTVTHTQSTVTTTLTATVTTTPVVTKTETSTVQEISESTLPAVTTTVPAATARGTKTIHPSPITITKLATVTYTVTKRTPVIAYTTSTKTATCIKPTYQPRRQLRSDRRRSIIYDKPEDMPPNKRAAGDGALAKRVGPNGPVTTTVTAATPVVVFTPGPVTSTDTQTKLVTTTSVSTVTPDVVTSYSGVFTRTVTLPTRTRTVNIVDRKTVTVTKPFTYTVTVRTTTTPAAVRSACAKRGQWCG
ncbi:hypothetical protein PT974_07428 [Cladobotryum mycophilum]|uniref:Uncharacterized protein n=1 Tax=Cladobotryum mycophilum TaxID=491253 RepID=A0ABR0SPF9_9HYPO